MNKTTLFKLDLDVLGATGSIPYTVNEASMKKKTKLSECELYTTFYAVCFTSSLSFVQISHFACVVIPAEDNSGWLDEWMCGAAPLD